MSISVGKAIKKIKNEGLTQNYFLLGNDSYLQKLFIGKLRNSFDASVPAVYLNLNDEHDMELLTADLQSPSMFSSKTLPLVEVSKVGYGSNIISLNNIPLYNEKSHSVILIL